VPEYPELQTHAVTSLIDPTGQNVVVIALVPQIEHDWHVLALNKSLYLPAAHDIQFPDPVTGLYVPAGQDAH
jgi:hypothetical protein